MKINYSLLHVFLSSVFLLAMYFFPISVMAVEENPVNQKTLNGGIGQAGTFAGNKGLSSNSNILGVIADIIEWLLALSAVLAMGALVWGGIMYIMSLGNEGRAETAKKVIMYAIIGVIVILLSFVIIQFIQTKLAPAAQQSYILPAIAQIPVAFAQDSGSGTSTNCTSTDKGFKSGTNCIDTEIAEQGSGLARGTDIMPVILNIVELLLSLVAVLALAALVWGAIMYIVSLGNESRTETAKRIILYAIVGVLVAGVSFLVINVLGDLFTRS